MKSFFLKKVYSEKCHEKVMKKVNFSEERIETYDQGVIIWYNLKTTNLCRLHWKKLVYKLINT